MPGPNRELNIAFREIESRGDEKKYLVFSEFEKYLQEWLQNNIERINHEFSFKRENNKEDSPDLVIVFVRMQDLHNRETYDKITSSVGMRQDLYKELNSDEQKQEDINGRMEIVNAYPIIVIGLEDITRLTPSMEHADEKSKKSKQATAQIETDTEKKSEQTTREEKDKIERVILAQLNLDPRVQFFDSSIWYRYVALNEDFEKNFEDVLRDTLEMLHADFCVYNMKIAREYLEFQTRIMQNSFLAALSDGGHANAVTPFKFHSETLMKKKAQKDAENLWKQPALQWKVLLVDDYGDKPLAVVGDNGKNTPTKRDIIKGRLRNLPGFKIEAYNNSEDESDLDISWQKMSETYYDLILLDYLLGDRKANDPGMGGREYGCELLKRIHDHGDTIKKTRGPLNRFWIFPISAFSHAMLDEMRENGIAHFDRQWHLASGADPVCTPHLFRFKLQNFLHTQVSEVDYDISGFFEEHLKKACRYKKLRKYVRECYPAYFRIYNYYKTLARDEDDSDFARSMKAYLDSKTHESIWEHLNHLLYLIAFGAGVVWPEMWEECNFIEKKLKVTNSGKHNPVRTLNHIRKYIIDVQKQYK